MSRVKQPIAEAKEFAVSAGFSGASLQENDGPVISVSAPHQSQTPNSNDEAALATRQDSGAVPRLSLKPTDEASTFISDPDGNAIAYTSEQQLLNMQLREAVITVENDSVALANRFLTIFESMRKDNNALFPRRTATLSDFEKQYVWPALPQVEPQAIVNETATLAAAAEIRKMSSSVDAARRYSQECSNVFADLLRGGMSLKRRQEAQEALAPASRLLLEDETITSDIIMAMHDLAQGDVFAYTKSELNSKQRELDALKDDLERTSAAKQDALHTGDVRTAETCTLREIDICERIIDRMRQRVEIIYQCDGDVREYSEKFRHTRDAADARLREHEEKVKEWMNKVTQDIDTLTTAKTSAWEQNDVDQKEFEEKKGICDAAIISVQNKQNENWEKIRELLEFNQTLASQRAKLVEEKVALNAAEAHRAAQYEAWSIGLEDYIEEVKSAQETIMKSSEWINAIHTYVHKASTKIEESDIDDEAWRLRVQEQLDYLKAYKNFKTLLDDITHRKEMRVMSLQRVVRNLQLQIKEAAATLDPNSKKYEADVLRAEDEIGKIETQLAELRQRAGEQHKQWKIIEESLERDRVDFIPPDIDAEKELCDKKSQALTIARQFVVSEQETVDKDTMKLRKLKTSNQVAIEGLQKRRADRQHGASIEDNRQDNHPAALDLADSA